MRPSASATKRIAAPSSSDSASSPYQSQKPVPERTDPGDAECQPDGKGSLRPNAIKNVSEVSMPDSVVGLDVIELSVGRSPRATSAGYCPLPPARGWLF